MNRRSFWLAGLALSWLILSLAAGPVAADTVDEIVRMLEGGLSEELILDWLDAAEEAPARPAAEELLKLKRAGASEELLRELVRRSRPQAPPPASPAAAVLAPAAEGPESVDPVPVDPVPGVSGGVSGATAVVRFRLLYAPRFDDGEESWDLLVYLDGRPLSYVPASSDPLGLTAGDPLQVELALPVGSHTLRLLQERHERSRRGWRHAARAAPPAFVFELSAGADAKVDLEFHQSWGQLTDPLTFRFSQEDRIVDREDVGGDSEYWPELCEDAGREPSRDDCLGWASLWPGISAPPLGEVREALSRFAFRPVPR